MLLLTRFENNNGDYSNECMWNYEFCISDFDIKVIVIHVKRYLHEKLSQAMVLDVWHAHTIKCQANDLRGSQQSITYAIKKTITHFEIFKVHFVQCNVKDYNNICTIGLIKNSNEKSASNQKF